MFDYQAHFDRYCRENGLELRLSFDMPPGYETANGTFDTETKTVFLNAALLRDAPEHEQAFYFFHELRHAAQYLRPERFSDAIRRSLRYVIQYDGTCYKRIGGRYAECRLDGGAERFTDLYLGQPHEADANAFAYAQVRALFGGSDELRKLYEFWTPRQPIPDPAYDAVFAEIDEKTKQGHKVNQFIIRGPRGVGKSTLIRRLIEAVGADCGGFVTKKAVPDAGGVTQIHIYPAALPPERRLPSEDRCVGACSAGRMLYRRREVFDTLGVAYLNDTAGRDLLVMDELGFMESEAAGFQRAVLRALDGDLSVLAAVKDKDVPFLAQVCSHPNARVWDITRDNRDALFEELLPLLKQAIE